MQYQKELKKAKILLGMGVVLALFIFIGASKDVGDNIFEGMLRLLRVVMPIY